MKLQDVAVDDLPQWLHELVIQTTAALARALSDESTSVAQAEEQVVELTREMGRKALGRGLSERYGTHEGPHRACQCGALQRFERYREKTLMTLLGPVRYRRAYYRCASCPESYYEGDDVVGLDEGSYSLPAQEAVALVACEVPFEAGRQMLGRLTGIEPASSHAQSITQRHGQELEQRGLAEREALFAGELELLPEGAPKRLYVVLDGLQTPFVDDWHETKIGAVYEAKVGEGGIDEPVATTYVCGAWEGPEQFGKRLYQEAVRRGVERAGEVVVIGDGAVWIWNQVAEHFPEAVQVLDFWHAAERLHEVGRAVYGEGAAQARQWAEANKERLRECRVDDVLRSLRAVRASTGEGREAVRLAVGYFRTNRRRMDYPGYRARGYHVGSGVVEAACKTVAAARCKRSGMRWTKEGLQSVLNLRCQLLNARWDRYWKPLKATC